MGAGNITIDSTFTNPNLPIVLDTQTQLLQDANLINWFEADASATAYGTAPAIATFLDKKGTARVMGQVTATNRAVLSGQINGYSAALFTPANSNGYTITPTAKLGTSFSLIWFGVPNLVNVQYFYCKNITASPEVQTLLYINPLAGHQIVALSAAGGVVTAPYAPSSASPLLVIASYNATTQIVNIRVNGVTGTGVSATGTVGTALEFFGSLAATTGYLDGLFSDFMIRDDDLLTNTAALTLTEEFFVGTYGLGFKPYGSF